MTTPSADGQETGASVSLSPTQARQHHQHHRHHSRRSQAQPQSQGPNSDAGSDSEASESGSTSCSTASSYSVDYGTRRGRRHRHHRVSYADSRRRSTGGRARSDTETSGDTSSGRRSTESTENLGDDEQNVRARQEALNTRHPFGLPIWKPALYKKSRSVTRAAFLALHARPLRSAALYLRPGNLMWMLLAGWPLLLVCLAIAA
ncbi:hypothetical protein IW150_007346, partial [Coemansia sp. RSA 2607]